MNILLSRIDERLIHGQVMTRWITGLYITRIILIDDNIAKDDFMVDVLLLSAPMGVEVQVMAVEDAVKFIASDDSTTKTMLLFKDIRFVQALADSGFMVPKLNIGNIGSSPIRKGITREVFMSPEEQKIAKDLCGRGMYIYIQKLPSDKEQDIMTLL